MTPVATALRAQAAALLALADALDKPDRDTDPDPWVRVVQHVNGAVPARVVNGACAAGQVKGAVKKGKAWIARRSDVDSWLSSSGQVKSTSDAAELARMWGAR